MAPTEDKYTYLYAEGKPFAIYKSNTDELFYLHLDYQGSLMAISNLSEDVIERRSYDAWGRPREPNTWSYDLGAAFAGAGYGITIRGYTMHEHLEMFSLINMNGRLYDPVLGRMLSPDNYIQAPENTQSYNRYSYCWNNPLKYTDPTGNLTWSDVGAGLAVIGGVALLATGNPYGAVLIAGGGSHFINTLNGVINNNQTWDDASNRSGLVFSGTYNTDLTSGQTYNEQQQQIKITQIENKIYANQNQSFYEYIVNSSEYEQLKNYGDVYACDGCPLLDVKPKSKNMAGALLISGGLIADDATVAGVIDDIAIPFLIGGAYLLDKYSGKGNVNYPGPWTYTYKHPSQNPINNPPRGFDPNEPPSNLSNGIKWFIAGKILYEMREDYNNYRMQITPIVNKKDKTYVSPQIIPYRR